MKSIVKTAEKLIKEKEDFVNINDIVQEIETGEINNDKLKARIYTDLLSDGRFFFKNNYVNLTENFTMEEISKIKSAYSVEKLVLEETRLEEETMNLQMLRDETEGIENDEELDVEGLIENDLTLFGIDDD